MQVALVLRSGGEYRPAHVQVLAKQIEQWLPGARVFCISDVDVQDVRCLPMLAAWPGWWAKMELFAPRIKGDILFMDLDTVVRGPLEAIASVGRLTVLRDFYRPRGLGSGLMYIPEVDRAEVWDAWMQGPAEAQAVCGGKGDQAFLERFWLHKAARWQDVLPGQVVSYKVHVNPDWKHGTPGTVPETASVVCHHGKPRPWDSLEFKRLYH